MLLILMGPSCTGKSTLAESLKKDREVDIYTGKDYLRFAKNENEAWNKFSEKLLEATISKEFCNKTTVYIITEKNMVSRMQSFDNTIFIKFTAELDTVKERFAKRMNGNLPKPLEKMLEKQLNEWENVECDLCIDTTNSKIEEQVRKITEAIEV
ncbi:MAG: hypothetical protein ACRDA5_15525 [Clostridium sp.]